MRLLGPDAQEVEGIYMETLFQIARDECIDVDPIIAELSLDRADFLKPEKRFTYRDFYAAVDRIEQAGVEGLGLKMGQREGVLTHGMLGYACIAAPNLRESLNTYIRYAPHIGLDITLTLGMSGDMAIVTAIPHGDLGKHLRFSIEEIFANWLFIGKVLRGGRLPCHDIHLTYKPPMHSGLYADAFGCPVRFGQESNQMRFKADELDRRFITANRTLFKICKAQCETLYVRHSRTGSLAGAVRRALVNRPAEPPKLAALADEFGLSARSLRRHLRAEETSYQALLHEVRMELAADYLATTVATPDEISHLIGFEEVASFYRNFKRWSGTTPQAYRQAHKE